MQVHLNDLLHIAPCGIFSLTEDGLIISANNTLLNILHYSPGELEGMHIEEIFTVSTRIFYQTHLFPLLKMHGKADEIFVTLNSKTKQQVPVLINAVQSKMQNEVLYVFACITVHQRNKYEEEILLAKKMAEEALQTNEHLRKVQHELEAGKQALDQQLTELQYKNQELLQLNDLVAHDLQEPVRKIILFSDIITKNKERENKVESAKSLDVIARSAEKMQSVLRNLQEYMHISSGTIRNDTVNLNDVISRSIGLASSKNPGVIFHSTVETLPVVQGDQEQLQLLFDHIIENSFRFRSLERNLQLSISCSLFQHNSYKSLEEKYNYVEFVAITIADNGMGFNPDYKELIFKMLKKLDAKSKGLGLGLAICRRITENHRGYMTATAEENKGAKFTVSLPVGQR